MADSVRFFLNLLLLWLNWIWLVRVKSTHLHSTPSPIRSSMVCRAKIGGRLGGPVGPSAAHGGLRQVPNMVMMMMVMMTMTLTMTKTKLIIVLIMIVIVLCSFYILLLYNIIYDIRLLYSTEIDHRNYSIVPSLSSWLRLYEGFSLAAVWVWSLDFFVASSLLIVRYCVYCIAATQ